jgi:hypothetical protein
MRCDFDKNQKLTREKRQERSEYLCKIFSEVTNGIDFQKTLLLELASKYTYEVQDFKES